MLQFNIGEREAAAGLIFGCGGLIDAEQIQERAEEGDRLLRFLRIGAALNFVPGQGMLHHGVFQFIAFPVVFRDLAPDTNVFSRRHARHGLEHASAGSGMPAPILIRRNLRAAIAMPVRRILRFVQQLEGRPGKGAGLTVPCLVDRNVGIPNQPIGDGAFVPAQIFVVDMVRRFENIVCRILIVLCAQNLLAKDPIALLILSIIRMLLYGAEVQRVIGFSVRTHRGNRKVLQSRLPAVRLGKGEGVGTAVGLNDILPIGQLAISFSLPGSVGLVILNDAPHLQVEGKALRAGIVLISAVILPDLLHIQRGGFQLVLNHGSGGILRGVGSGIRARHVFFIDFYAANLGFDTAVLPFIAVLILRRQVGEGVHPGVALRILNDIA